MECGRSSGVEHNLAKVRVVSSNLIARSNIFPRGRKRKAAFGPLLFFNGFTIETIVTRVLTRPMRLRLT